MKKILAMVLCMALLVSAAMFVSCGDKGDTKNENKVEAKASVEGTWKSDIDMSAMFGVVFEQMFGMEMKLEPLYIPVVVEITSDTWKLDVESPDKAAEDTVAFINELVDENIDALIEVSAAGNGISADDLLAAMEAQGISKADFADMMKEQVIANMDIESMVSGMNENIAISIEGNTIVQESGATIEFELNGDTLVLSTPKDADGNDVETFGLYPMTLTRK